MNNCDILKNTKTAKVIELKIKHTEFITNQPKLLIAPAKCLFVLDNKQHLYETSQIYVHLQYIGQ